MIDSKSTDTIKLSATKGRPLLQWYNKRPLKYIRPLPSEIVETYTVGSPTTCTDPSKNRLYYGDNKEVLATLIASGYRRKVNLIYIDPPFDSGADYVRSVRLRGVKFTQISGEGYSLGEELQYSDIWSNDMYLQFMYERLILLRELLADGGAIFVHCDSSRGYHLRCLLDEVFGPDSFVNEIIWSYRRWPSKVNAFQAMHDTILYYVNEIERRRTFQVDYEPASESYLERFGGNTQRLHESGTRKVPVEEATKGLARRDVWDDISIIPGSADERTGYPTQKPIELSRRIVDTCSNPGDIVLDCFSGSGTTLAAAQELGRNWIGCDINRGAIQTSVKRIVEVMRNQEQATLLQQDFAPSMNFDVFRTNGYGANMSAERFSKVVCDLLGAQQTQGDGFFDGVLGDSLLKVYPIDRALSTTDLEILYEELEIRAGETRTIVLACTDAELAAIDEINKWNRLRKSQASQNKLELLELRGDPKYGGLLRYSAPKVRMRGTKEKGKLNVEILDFVSPMIIQRLATQTSSQDVQIVEWRSMVDCIMIDTEYDGTVFRPRLQDIPETKADLVSGQYSIPAPYGDNIGVKIIDMLGDEVFVSIATANDTVELQA